MIAVPSATDVIGKIYLLFIVSGGTAHAYR